MCNNSMVNVIDVQSQRCITVNGYGNGLSCGQAAEAWTTMFANLSQYISYIVITTKLLHNAGQLLTTLYKTVNK